MSTHSEFDTADPYTYHNGFPSYHESEAFPDSLPTARNSPQKHPLGLYTEKLSGSAFTAPRAHNHQTWLYRILPSAHHHDFTPHPEIARGPETFTQYPTQLRWSPFQLPSCDTTFPAGIQPVGGVGSAPLKEGLQISVYTATKSMPERQAFYSADGDFLIVPQHGDLDVRTELGRLYVRPTEILVIPRGIRFNVALPQGVARGYILETFAAAHWELPELGPIGSNGLANARDFQVPKADYLDDGEEGMEFELVAKFDGKFFTAKQYHSAFDVVAWHGNYYPMKYDLNRFNTIGSISYDHPDPSIFTVLTCPSAIPGTAVADFVVFPPRWLVAEDTFRPPWFHRNCMSEFMGLIKGGYDGKTGGGFVAGGASLHNVMAGHGPDANTVDKASNGKLEPRKEASGIAFMFESMYMLGVTKRAFEGEERQKEYLDQSWGGVKRMFKGNKSE